jgi:hypothetical protein
MVYFESDLKSSNPGETFSVYLALISEYDLLHKFCSYLRFIFRTILRQLSLLNRTNKIRHESWKWYTYVCSLSVASSDHDTASLGFVIRITSHPEYFTLNGTF